MANTTQQYDKVINACKDIFFKKYKDYGTSWRVMRIISVTDQIFIKAQRIRNIQETKTQVIADDIYAEFKGIVNYCIIGLIQLQLNNPVIDEMEETAVTTMYNNAVEFAKNTMLEKNQDYGEAWRNMSEESMVDLILTKLQRIRQILQNKGKTLVSEGIDANFVDMMNYAVFALILTDKFD